MLAPRIPRTVLTSKREPREGNSPAHLACIRKLPCCLCGAQPADPHHLMQTGERGMGMRSPDRYAIPLCRHHHDALHSNGSKNEETFLAEQGIDGRALAAALWRLTGDIEAMHRAVFRAWQGARLNV